jgi:hypothetical protein
VVDGVEAEPDHVVLAITGYAQRKVHGAIMPCRIIISSAANRFFTSDSAAGGVKSDGDDIG